MALTTPDNIWTPDAGEQYALTTDLATTADSIQNAITKKANYGVGTTAEMNAAVNDFPNGALWFNTTNNTEYRRVAGAWVGAVTDWLSITPGPLYAGSDLYVCQVGREVSFFGQATRTSGSPGDTSNETIGYLPAAISRPQWNQAHPGMGTNANVGKIGIRTDGEIFVAGAVTGGGYIRLDAVRYTTFL